MARSFLGVVVYELHFSLPGTRLIEPLQHHFELLLRVTRHLVVGNENYALDVQIDCRAGL